MSRHLLSLLDLQGDEILALLDRADLLREAWGRRELPSSLSGRAVALWFEDEGFRNRVAFELGVQALGGTLAHLSRRFDTGESPEDVAAYLANWFDCVVVRTRDHQALRRFASAASIPVVNARTADNHPCEVLGDLQYVRSLRGSLEGLRVTFVGEATNLGHAWLEAAARLPIRVVQVCPPGYEVAAERLARLRQGARGELHVTCDLLPAVGTADVLYTDCWPLRRSEVESERVERDFAPYRITRSVLEHCAPDALFLPCPPVHRGEEVAAEVMSSPRCHVPAAKECLLHVQNALLEQLIAAA